MAQPPSNDNSETANNNEEGSNAAAPLSPVVKIKEEKIDPEIENKIKLLEVNIKTEPPEPNDDTEIQQTTNGHHAKTKDSQDDSDDEEEDSNDSDSSSQENDDEEEEEAENGGEGGEEDEKKNIEPVKSSNEILTELFQVFNAAPPEELLDDKNLIKKAKKHKKEKKKKHKKQKGESGELVEGEEGEISGGEKHKHKKSKKKHKHKHKDGSKEKDKEKDKDKCKSKDKEKDKERAKSKDKEKDKSKSDKRSSERDKSRDRARSKERARSKDRAKSKDRDKKLIESGDRDKYEKSSKSGTERKRHYDKEEGRAEQTASKRKRTEEKDGKTNSFYNGFKEREHSRERQGADKEKIKIKLEPKERKSRRHSEEGQISEISLSDEETFLKEKETTRSDYSKRKQHNSFYDGVKRSRSRDKDRGDRHRGHNDDRYRDRDRDRDRRRERDNSYRNRGFSRPYHSRYSRSRSRSRSRDLGIDKKRLLEIARKNAISMFKRGSLPGCDNMSQEIKDKVLLKMRYGGRTVEDLTEFCKKISNGENLSDLSSDEDSDVDKSGNTKAFHHPFQLKEREPIVMHIRNSKPILPILAKTEEQTKAITMQFPVSSGQQHRMTEHWVPVETKDNLAPLPALPSAAQSTTIFKSTLPKNALGKPLPMAEQQEPAFKPVPAPGSETTSLETTATATLPPLDGGVGTTLAATPTPVAAPQAIPNAILPPTPIPPPAIANPASSVNAAITLPASTPAFVPDVPVPSTNSSVFPKSTCTTLDVSSIISKRLNAMRRLQENPMDSEAIKMMYNSQKEMSSWASSKHLPGQFTGSTGVNVLKPNELNSGPQVWARKDQLTSTKPVTGGMGMHLLQKMGWKPGEGLGREKNGSLQPLLLDVKLDKRGLVAQEDCNRRGMPMKKRGGGGGGSGGGASHNSQLAQQNLEEKHPVCLLNELTSKRKWTPPLYTLVNEKGPSHSKMFLFSVQVNGQTFTPERACNTKKEAKMIAAKHCLQQIGILPAC